jgi:diguanylate cyclase (GGDEF)-like protein/PAS domain S-box-containing protein
MIHKRSNMMWTIIMGFGFMFLIMLFFWSFNLQQTSKMYQTIENSRIASEKMAIIVSMIEIARARTRLTNELIFIDDPFVQDEINVELDIYASRFGRERESLLATGLSDIEMDILKRQSVVITPTLALQRKSAEMAMSGDPEAVKEARRILIFQVYPGQGKIIDHFMELLNLQKQIIDQATVRTAQEQQFARGLATTLLFSLLIIGILGGLFVIMRTARMERELFLEKERALITLKSIGDAVITTDKKGRIEYLNPVAEKITGYMNNEMRGAPINDVFKAFDEANKRWLSDCVMTFLREGSYATPSNDIVLFTRRSEKIDISLTMAPIQSEDHKVLGIIATFQDISTNKHLTRQIEHQAKHDSLTGLLNRREFEQKVSQSLALYSENTSHAFCVMDLDRFKIVNDSVGHAAGDELLRQITSVIQECLRRSDLFARIGGDEFALFLNNIDIDDASRLCEKITQQVSEFQFLWGKSAFRIGISIGMVESTPETTDYNHLFHAADTACYLAKHEGRNRLKVVDLNDANLSATSEQTRWATRITHALENNEFVLYGQEIRPLQNQDNSSHLEVLIRLIDSDTGEMIPPGAFIPAAERYNLMAQIDDWVVRKVINAMVTGDNDEHYALNLSGQSMGNDKFAHKILTLIEESDFDTSKLSFEITETAAISNLENAKSFLRKLNELGCKTALDDFGSGLSSFGYLRDFPVNFLKIDGMFIKQITEDDTSRVMVEAIHAIGKTMDLETIAEFVEDDATLNLIRKIGIDYAQGYHLGKPVPLNI